MADFGDRVRAFTRRREWARPTDNTDVFPAISDDDIEPDDAGPDVPDVSEEPAAARDVRLRAQKLGQATVARLPQLSVVIIAGVLLCLSFPPFGWWYLAFVAPALLAWVLTRETTTVAGGFGYGFLFGLVFYLPLLPWISGLVGAFPWIALSVLEALFPGLFGALAVVVRRQPGWPLWFAGLWATQEWLKSSIPFGGFPWGVVAFSQSDGPLLPIAQLGGSPLLSFAVVLTGFSLAAITLEVVQWWRREEDEKGVPPAVVVPGACIAVVLLATALAWPHVRQSGVGSGADQAITVAAVQGNVPRLGLEFNAQRRAVLDNHVQETVRLAEDVRAGRVPQPTLVIWPENSSDIDPLANPDARAEISDAAAAINAPILVGGVVAAPGYSRDNPVSTNSVIVWNPGTGPAERHDKQIVQPFGEYLPWRGFFRLLSSYADRAGYFIPGSGNGVVHAAGVPVGVTTCWEVIFDRAPRESVRNGAQLLTVPTNNATFDEAMSEQQLAFARLRAVEHDRYVIVAGTTGISAVIAPDGRELARTAFFEPAYLDTQVRLKTQLTTATQWAPLIEGLLVAVGVGAVIVAILHNGSFVRRLRPATKDRGVT
ncbi:MAG: apolipoprotein N-acyltransferase [Mycobacterium sp.]|jgi:apolipoprotein N-acyltransferase|nr:apolipoprotein N-acyltransferase [Mycobacterium sp.]